MRVKVMVLDISTYFALSIVWGISFLFGVRGPSINGAKTHKNSEK